MQRKRKGNDRQAYQSHIKRQEAYERGWLDDADEEYPDYGEAEAYDTEKMAGLVRGQPVVSGYEALERRRGRRKPPRKLTRREKRAMKKAEDCGEETFKSRIEKGKGEASFGTEIHTIPGNGKGRYLPGTGEILFQNHPIL